MILVLRGYQDIQTQKSFEGISFDSFILYKYMDTIKQSDLILLYCTSTWILLNSLI